MSVTHRRASRLSLFPEIAPYRTGRLKVRPCTSSTSRNAAIPDGKPAVLLHGGPGGGSTAVMRRYHDPARYRIVLFDQRGCGRSTPHASLEDNTTWHLVADIEQLREHLGIERWQVFGGSWGSTLALAYAETHPERVTELVLRGIFMLRRAELEWFYQEGCSWIFPEAFEEYLRPIPPAGARRPDRSLLPAPDRSRPRRAARGRARLERVGGQDAIAPAGSRARAPLLRGRLRPRLRAHRVPLLRQWRLLRADDQLLRGAQTVCKRIPGVIVHGRYDVVTPAKIAVDLARAWPEADLRIVADAGHAMTEPGIVHELVSATNRFAR